MVFFLSGHNCRCILINAYEFCQILGFLGHFHMYYLLNLFIFFQLLFLKFYIFFNCVCVCICMCVHQWGYMYKTACIFGGKNWVLDALKL